MTIPQIGDLIINKSSVLSGDWFVGYVHRKTRKRIYVYIPGVTGRNSWFTADHIIREINAGRLEWVKKCSQ